MDDIQIIISETEPDFVIIGTHNRIIWIENFLALKTWTNVRQINIQLFTKHPEAIPNLSAFTLLIVPEHSFPSPVIRSRAWPKELQ